MIDPKLVLKHFSIKPITYNDLVSHDFDLSDKEFQDAFTWLESEQYIRPLHANSCGFHKATTGGTWNEVDIIITEGGNNYLNPQKPESDKLKNWFFKPVIVALVISFIVWSSSKIHQYSLQTEQQQEEKSQK